MNRKGSFADLLYLLTVALVLAIVFTAGWLIYSKVNDRFQANDQIATEGKTMFSNFANRYVEIFDGLFFVVIAALYVGAMVLAWNVDTNPIFFFLSIIVFAVLVILAASFGNVYYDYSQQDMVSSYADDFTIIPFVMNNLVQVIIAMAFGLAGVMYAKVR